MDILDINGRKIIKGTTLKYLRTRTIGKAEDIRFDCGEAWIRLDSTGLYYLSEYLRVIEPLEKIKKRKKSTPKEKFILNISKSKKQNKSTSNVISDYPDGPGYGGG